MKLSITQKGLACLLLPLALQIACIAQLYVLVSQAADLAAQEARLARMVRIKDEILHDFSSTWQDFFSRTKPSARDVDDVKRRTDKNFREIRSLMKDDKQYALPVDELQRATDRQFDLMGKVNVSDSGSMLSKVQALLYLQHDLEEVGGQLQPFWDQLETDRDKLEEAGRKAEVARNQIKTQVLIGIAVEIVLTLGIIALFLQDIRKRLSILVDNARAIPANQSLTKKVSGSDELAYLDKVLHEASDDLHKAAEYRKSLMQMVAHDLRSPLGTAKLEADNIATLGGKIDSRLDESGKRMKTIIGQLIYFVEDLLTIDKLEAGKLELRYEAVDVHELVDDALSGVEPLARVKRIELINKTETITIGADPQRIMQVLNNLLSNAIKFSPTDKSITVSAISGQGEIRISVKDEGPGIAADQQSKLFDKYFQSRSHNPKDGFGLGLAICMLIVKQHEGKIGVDSEPGQGSTFWFTLPLDEDEDV